VGESIYNVLTIPSSAGGGEAAQKDFPNNDISFREVNLDPAKWKYLSHSDPDSMYRVYEYIEG
jgi:hypothetical protein